MALCAFLVCIACNPRDRVERARKAAEGFHSLYNKQDFVGMYQFAGAAVRESTSESAFTSYEKGVRGKLGALQAADVLNYNITYVLSGPQVRLDYASRYERGTAVESFEINFRNGRPVIDGYRIDSPQLGGKP